MSESDVLRTKQTHEKNRVQGRIPTDRLGYSLSQIAEVTFGFVIFCIFFFADDEYCNLRQNAGHQKRSWSMKKFQN